MHGHERGVHREDEGAADIKVNAFFLNQSIYRGKRGISRAQWKKLAASRSAVPSSDPFSTLRANQATPTISLSQPVMSLPSASTLRPAAASCCWTWFWMASATTRGYPRTSQNSLTASPIAPFLAIAILPRITSSSSAPSPTAISISISSAGSPPPSSSCSARPPAQRGAWSETRPKRLSVAVKLR